MKLKALLLACAVAGAGASFALADDGHGKHGHHSATTTGTTTTGTTTTGTTTTTTTPANCVRIEVAGTLASVSAKSFTLTVTKVDDDNDDDDNNGASAGSLVGQTLTFAVDANTRVRWQGTGTLIGPNVGDRARVDAFSCGTPAAFTARRVNAEGPRAAGGDAHVNAKSHK